MGNQKASPFFIFVVGSLTCFGILMILARREAESDLADHMLTHHECVCVQEDGEQ